MALGLASKTATLARFTALHNSAALGRATFIFLQYSASAWGGRGAFALAKPVRDGSMPWDRADLRAMSAV